jgi:hypothetical protein
MWIVAGVLTYGIFLADFRSSHTLSCRKDQGYAVGLGLTGPVGLLNAFITTGFAEHGMQFSCGVEE